MPGGPYGYLGSGVEKDIRDLTMVKSLKHLVRCIMEDQLFVSLRSMSIVDYVKGSKINYGNCLSIDCWYVVLLYEG